MSVSVSRLFMVCLALLSASPVFAASYVVPTDQHMVRTADAIVIAAALTSYSQETADGRIETVTPMSVEEVIKGSFSADVVNIHVPGGELGELTLVVPGAPRFAEGERHLVFLTRTKDGTWTPTQFTLGKFSFATDRVGQKLLVRQEADIVGWDLQGRTHRERRRLADKFLDAIRTEVRGGMPKVDYFTSSNQLQAAGDSLQTETAAASTSPKSYNMAFGDAANGVRWNSFPTPLTYYYYFQDNLVVELARAVTAVDTAIGSWTNDAGSNVPLVNGGMDPFSTAADEGGYDGVQDFRQTIVFEVPLSGGTFTCGGGGLLGVGGFWAGGTHTGPAGETFYTIAEGDVSMNKNVLGCASFPAGDLASTLAHEVGHTLSFRHSDQARDGGACVASSTHECSSSAIMKASLLGGLNGALQTWDINAVRAVYPETCSVPSISSHPASTTIASGSSTSLSVTASGATSYQWYVGSSGNTASPIGGATSSSVSVSPTSNTNYWVRVTNACGSANSNTATVTVTVAPACTYAISPSAATFSRLGGSGSVNITSNCTNWTATSNAAFLAIVGSGIEMSGNGSISYTVAVNNTGSQRSGTLTVAGHTFTVTQTARSASAHTDFNGDGFADLLWRSPGSSQNAPWLMNGSTIAGSGLISAIADPWTVKGIGDFNGDGKADILWRDLSPGAGQAAIWFMNGTTVTSGAFIPAASSEWIVQGVGDFNADGKSDILWRNDATYEAVVWIMNGASITSSATVAVPGPQWTINGVGDFNGDGRADILWRNTSTHEAAVWLMNGAAIMSASYVASPHSIWTVKGVGDFNGDGMTDIFWVNNSNQTVVWLMNGLSIITAGYSATPPLGWDIQSVGDTNADGKADLMWRNLSTGQNALWFMNGVNVGSSTLFSPVGDLGWNVVGPR